MTPDLSAQVGSVELANPVMTAAGTSGHGAELANYFDLSRLGAVVVKSLSVEPWDGNPGPRLQPLEVGMLNSVGLHNPGAAAWLERDLPRLLARGATVVASVWGRTFDDYRKVGAVLSDGVAHGTGGRGRVVAVELNISCPNLEDRDRMFAHSPEGAATAVAAALEGLGGSLPVWAKLSPDVSNLSAIAVAAFEAGADAVTLVNTTAAMAIDPSTGEALLGAGGGGLSGPALHPIAVRAVHDCRAALLDLAAGFVPEAEGGNGPAWGIVGVGGVSSGETAAELLCAGADAVQVGTATFADPRAPIRVLDGLSRWCEEHTIAHLGQLRGMAHRKAPPSGAPRYGAAHAFATSAVSRATEGRLGEGRGRAAPPGRAEGEAQDGIGDPRRAPSKG